MVVRKGYKMSDELDLGPIEERLKRARPHKYSTTIDPFKMCDDIAALIAEVKRLREANKAARLEGARIMLNELEARSHIGPSDYCDIVEELEGGRCLFDEDRHLLKLLG